MAACRPSVVECCTLELCNQKFPSIRPGAEIIVMPWGMSLVGVKMYMRPGMWEKPELPPTTVGVYHSI